MKTTIITCLSIVLLFFLAVGGPSLFLKSTIDKGGVTHETYHAIMFYEDEHVFDPHIEITFPDPEMLRDIMEDR